mmetsp:Transcript_63514/g.194236  ORF Transcript_63514/g.194236 Transcript_63514/m.194236 type:complete len:360 (-) Transcript_63514:111-1190(-)
MPPGHQAGQFLVLDKGSSSGEHLETHRLRLLVHPQAGGDAVHQAGHAAVHLAAGSGWPVRPVLRHMELRRDHVCPARRPAPLRGEVGRRGHAERQAGKLRVQGRHLGEGVGGGEGPRPQHAPVPAAGPHRGRAGIARPVPPGLGAAGHAVGGTPHAVAADGPPQLLRPEPPPARGAADRRAVAGRGGDEGLQTGVFGSGQPGGRDPHHGPAEGHRAAAVQGPGLDEAGVGAGGQRVGFYGQRRDLFHRLPGCHARASALPQGGRVQGGVPRLRPQRGWVHNAKRARGGAHRHRRPQPAGHSSKGDQRAQQVGAGRRDRGPASSGRCQWRWRAGLPGVPGHARRAIFSLRPARIRRKAWA